MGVRKDFIAAAQGRGQSRVRWVICSLLLFATTVNYLDRQVIGLLAKELTDRFKWSELQYGYIITSFQISYMIGLLLVGRILDAVGTRVGFAAAAVLWSIASVAHALAGPWYTFAAARFALGLAEAANFPAAVKSTAEWFPRRERALATGIFNSGSNVGVIVAALMIPFVATHFGWRWTFVLTGLPGLVFAGVWFAYYRRPREHAAVSAGELELIESDPADVAVKVGWLQLIRYRQTWAYAAGKFLTDPVWWFYLYWGPKYFDSAYRVSLKGLVLPLLIIYVAADVGSVGGGWISSALLQRGWTVNRARKTAMLICAVCTLPMVCAGFVHNLWVSVALMSLAAAAHQGWSCNVYTLVSDMFPRSAVGSVIGFGAMFGAGAGILASLGIGAALQFLGGSYTPILVIAGCMYIVTLGLVHALSPGLEPVAFAEATGPKSGFTIASVRPGPSAPGPSQPKSNRP